MSGKEDKNVKKTGSDKDRQKRIDYEANDMRKAYKERFI